MSPTKFSIECTTIKMEGFLKGIQVSPCVRNLAVPKRLEFLLEKGLDVQFKLFLTLLASIIQPCPHLFERTNRLHTKCSIYFGWLPNCENMPKKCRFLSCSFFKLLLLPNDIVHVLIIVGIEKISLNQFIATKQINKVSWIRFKEKFERVIKVNFRLKLKDTNFVIEVGTAVMLVV